jgi:hypothetical protein
MADFYVLSSKKLVRHATYAAAALERERLIAKNGDGREIYIYRCKTTIRSNGNYTDMEAYVRRQAEAGCAEAAALIARVDAQQASHPAPQAPSIEAAA